MRTSYMKMQACNDASGGSCVKRCQDFPSDLQSSKREGRQGGSKQLGGIPIILVQVHAQHLVKEIRTDLSSSISFMTRLNKCILVKNSAVAVTPLYPTASRPGT